MTSQPEIQRKTVRQTSNKENIGDSDLKDSNYWLRIAVGWTETGDDNPTKRVPVREESNQIQRKEESRSIKVYGG